ncbi:MAG: sugar phosphate isomerase/epimerase [Terracidiphilus sp.]|jgi:sugar phosphate isomerase/epimerase
MELKLAVADYSFPLLEWEQSLKLAREIGMDGVDVALFAAGSHLQPDKILEDPKTSAAGVSATLRAHGLQLADVFGIPGTGFDQNAPNDPDVSSRHKSAEYFQRILEFAVRCNASHLTLLPGVHFPQEQKGDSLKRAAEELEWRAQAAERVGVKFAIEPHLGSVVPTPEDALNLLKLAPTLTLTLDPSHFIRQGITEERVLTLVSRTSHFHARCAREGRLQAPLRDNAVNFKKYLYSLSRHEFSGWICAEYTWIEWEQCNEVDNLSETILLRNLLRTAQSEVTASQAK